MVIFVAPVDDKCLKIDSASEIESRVSFTSISIISKYFYQINITHPSTVFREPSVKHCGLQLYTHKGRAPLCSEYFVFRVCGELSFSVLFPGRTFLQKFTCADILQIISIL